GAISLGRSLRGSLPRLPGPPGLGLMGADNTIPRGAPIDRFCLSGEPPSLRRRAGGGGVVRGSPATTAAAVLGLPALVAVLGREDLARPPRAAASAPAPAVATPGAGAMTVYSVTNPNAVTLNVLHAFSNGSGFAYSFWGQVAPGSTATYHVAAMAQIP